jgi:CBS domain containing-hemolysin-like protein
MEDILEEIVGEIWDEGDEAVEDIVKLDNDKYRVLSSTNITEFFEFFNVESIEETEATTVNGWVVERIGNIPEKGYSFEYENLVITVDKADELMTQEIIVEIIEKAETEEI